MEQPEVGDVRIRRALISVHDKAGLAELGRALAAISRFVGKLAPVPAA